MKRSKPVRITPVWAFVAVILVLALGFLMANRYQASHTASPTKTDNSTSTYNPQPKNTGTPSQGQAGGIADNNSPAPQSTQAPASPAPATGIVISSPASGAKVANGSTVAGRDPGSSVVNYRIKDNSSGVLTSGQLNVNAAGDFSGTVNGVHPTGSTGFVEIYNVNASTGVESGNVKVPVTF
jgi:cytoskeletal protein RodZ